MASVTDVISGRAVLDVSPFITSIQNMQKATIDAVNQMNTAIKGLGTTITPTLSAAQTAMKNFTSAVQSSNTSIGTLSNNATKIGTTMKNAATDVGSSVTEVDKLSTSLNNASTAAGNASKNLTSAATGYKNLGTAANSAATSVSKVGTSTNTAATSAKNLSTAGGQVSSTLKTTTSDVESFGTSLTAAEQQLTQVENGLLAIHRAGSQISSLGASFAMAGGAIDGMMAGVVNAATQTNFWQLKAEAASGATSNLTTAMGGSTQMTSQFEQAIDGLSVQIGNIKPEDVAQAFYYWTSATGEQITTTDQLAAASQQLSVILKGATMAGVDQAQSVRGVAQVLGEFGMPVSQAGDVMAKLTNITQTSDVEFSDLIQTFKMVGPSANEAGISFNDMVSIVGALADAGLRGSRVGSGLQQVITSFAKPTKQATDMLDQLLGSNNGVAGSWKDALYPGGQFVGILDSVNSSGQIQQGVVGQLHDALSKLDQQQQQQALHTIESQNGYRDLLPLIQSYKEGVVSLDKATGQYAITGGDQAQQQAAAFANSAQQADLFNQKWATVSQSIAVQWGGAMNKIKMGLVDLGTAVEQALLPVMAVVGDLVDGLRTWMAAHSALTRSIIQGIAIFGAFAVVIGTMLLAFGQLTQAIMSVQVAWTAMRTLGMVLIDTFGAWIPIIMLVVAALIALVQWSQSTAQLRDLFGQLGSSIHDMVSVAVTDIGLMITMIKDLISGNWQGAWNAFLNIVENAMVGFGNIFGSIGNILGVFFNAAISFLNEHFNGLGTQMVTWGENVISAFGSGMMNAISSYIVPAINAIVQSIASFLQGFSPPKEGPLKDITTWGTNVMNAYTDGMNKADMSVVEQAGSLIKDALDQVFQDAGSSADWSTYTSKFVDLRNEAQQAIDQFNQTGQVGAQTWAELSSALGSYASDLENVIVDTAAVTQAQTVVDTLKQNITNMQDSELPFKEKQQGYQAQIDQNNFQKDTIAQNKQAFLDASGQQNLQDQKDNLEYQKAADDVIKGNAQDQISLIEDQIAAQNELLLPIQEQLDNYSLQKQALQDQLTAINDRYQLEHAEQQDQLAAMQDQLDVQKAINDAANVGLEAQVNAAKDKLDAATATASLQEEGLQTNIDLLNASGQTGQAKILDEQLKKIQDLNKAHLDPLKLQYDIQNKALEDQKRAQTEAMATAQLQYTTLNAQIKLQDAEQKLQSETVVDNIKNQQLNIDLETLNLNRQKDNINLTIRSLKDSEIPYQDQIRAIDAEERTITAQERVIDLRLQAISQEAKEFDRQTQALDRQNANLQHLIQQIQLMSIDPIENKIKAAEAQEKDAELQLKAAQDKLAAANHQMAMDKQLIDAERAAKTKEDAAAKAAAKTAASQLGAPVGPTGMTPNQGYLGPPGTDWAAQTKADMAKFFNGNMDDIIRKLNPFGGLNSGFEDSKKKLDKQITNFGSKLSGLIDAVTGGKLSLGTTAGALFNQGQAVGGAMLGGRGQFGAAPLLGAMSFPLGRDLLYTGLTGAAPAGEGVADTSGTLEKILMAITGTTSEVTPSSSLLSMFQTAREAATGAAVGIGRGISSSGVGDLFRGLIGNVGEAYGAGTFGPAPEGAQQARGLLGFLGQTGRAPIISQPNIAESLLQRLGLGTFEPQLLTEGRGATGLVGRAQGAFDTAGGIGDLLRAGPIGQLMSSGVGGGLADFLKMITGGGLKAAGGALTRIGDAFGVVRAALGPIMAPIASFIEFLTRIPILGNAIRLIPVVGEILTVIQVVTTLRDAWINNWEGITYNFTQAFQKIMGTLGFLKSIWQDPDLNFGQKLQIIEAGIGSIMSDIGTAVGQIVHNIASDLRTKWLPELWTGISTYGPIVGGFLMQMIGGALTFLLRNGPTFIGNLVAAIVNFIAGAIQALDALVTSGGGGGGTGGKGGVGFGPTFGKMLGYVASWLIANGPAIALGIFQAILVIIGALLNLLGSLAQLFIDIGKALIGGIIAGIEAIGGDLGDAFLQLLTAAWNGIKQWAGISSPSTLFADIGNNLILGIITGIQNTWAQLTTIIGNLFNQFGTLVQTSVTTILDWITQHWYILALLTGPVLAPIILLIGLIITHWDQIRAAISTASTAIFNDLQTAFNNIRQTISTISTQISTDLSTWITAFETSIANFGTAIWTSITNTWTTIQATVTTFTTGVRIIITTWITMVQNDIEAFKGVFLGKFDQIKTGIQQKVADILAAGALWGQNLLNGITSTAGNIANTVLGFIVAAATAIVDYFSKIKDVGTGLAKTLVDAITSGLSNLGQDLINAVQNAVNLLKAHMPSMPSLPGFGSPGGTSGGAGNQPGASMWSQQSGQPASAFASQSQQVRDDFNVASGGKAGMGGGVGDTGIATGVGQAMINAAGNYLGSQNWDGMCESFVETLFGDATSTGKPNWGGTARDAFSNWQNSGAATTGYPTTPGQLVYFDWWNPENGIDQGHVGVYLGGGMFRSALDNGVQDMSIAEYLASNRSDLLGYVNVVPPNQYALGTNSAAGGLSLVGENGPEWANIPSGTKISANNQVSGIVNSYINGLVGSLDTMTKTLADALSSSITSLAGSLQTASTQPVQMNHTVNVYVDKMDLSSPSDMQYWIQQSSIYMSPGNL